MLKAFLVTLWVHQILLIMIEAQQEPFHARPILNTYNRPDYSQDASNRQYNSGRTQYQEPAFNTNNRRTSYQYRHPNQNLQNANMRPNHGRQQNAQSDNNDNKCKFWIPDDVFDKYPGATNLNIDARNNLIHIETCCDGYKKTNAVCRPICENCRNGICIQPGECQCYDGFVKNDNGDCVFSCPMGCENGQCYLDGTCKCELGYKLDRTRQYCQPICSAGCGQNIRHNCTAPEVCSCAKGYQLTDNGCEPVCDPECGIGGTCVEANECQCQSGYILKDGVCQADCYQKCENGICYSRNRCICKPGYRYHERSTYCVPT